MIRKIALLAAAVMLAACTSTETTHKRVTAAWVGKNVNLFFAANGGPGYKATNPDGTILYVWQEGTVVAIPGTVNVVKIGNSYHVNTIGGGSATLRCRVAIITDKTGKILRFTNMVSTIGAWQLSRCNEVLRY